MTSLAPNLGGGGASGAGAAKGSAEGSIIILTSAVTAWLFLNCPFWVTDPKYTFGKASKICRCFEKYK